MRRLKKLTLLHSNDLHGDFMAERVDDRLVGGVSMLSGYVNQVRHEEENVLYAIAGDMFRGSVIDSEYRGISTIEIMNLLGPDVATVGNHEADYGIAHMLFLEKCADFPIINANMHIKGNHARLFEPFCIFELGGMKVMFIGIVTEAVLNKLKTEGLLGTFVTLEDAAEEIGRICNTYHTPDVDLTVLLTHIGFQEDKRLASLLDPRWGVDIIIGGHSHTLLTEPVVVNGIPIVQVGIGTDQIGRFDIVVDTLRNCIDSYTWSLVPIDADHCPPDPVMEERLAAIKSTTDGKYGRIITRLDRELTHPVRNRETELGDLFSDVLRDALGVDVFLLGSGSIRAERLGPVVTLGGLQECFPYDDMAQTVYMTGAQLKHGLLHMLRDKALAGSHTEFYQLSHGLEIEYDQATHSFIRFDFEGAPIDERRVFSVGLQHYFFLKLEDSFDVTLEDLNANRQGQVVATSCKQVIEEVLAAGEYQDAMGQGRLVLHLVE